MGRPKTSCFAYRKVNGQSTCLALTELLCTKVKGGCPFYKTIPHFSIFNAVVSLSKCARRCIFVPLEKAVEIA